jgi:kynureninase
MSRDGIGPSAMSRDARPIEVPAGVNLPIYMDNQATCPLDPRVLEAMMPYLTTRFGNAASRSHSFGWEAEQAVEAARAQVARLIGALPREIVFTSGATESNNLALKGVAEANRERGDHIVTQATEHKAVLDTCRHLEKNGCRVTYHSVQRDGRIDPADVERAIGGKTILVSIMAANNEIGVFARGGRVRSANGRAEGSSKAANVRPEGCVFRLMLAQLVAILRGLDSGDNPAARKGRRKSSAPAQRVAEKVPQRGLFAC